VIVCSSGRRAANSPAKAAYARSSSFSGGSSASPAAAGLAGLGTGLIPAYSGTRARTGEYSYSGAAALWP
jgi:hypothetical protein